MPSSITSYRTLKPPLGSTLNRSHPLSQGLVFAAMMNEGGGIQVRDIASKVDATISGDISWKNVNVFNGGINGQITTKITSKLNVNTCTVLIKIKQISNTGWRIYALRDLPGGDRCWCLGKYGVGGASYHRLYVWVKASGNLVECFSDTDVLDNDKWYTIGFTFDGSKIQPFYNGRKSGVGVNLSGIITQSNTVPIRLLSEANTGASALNGEAEYCFFYNRALSPSEIQSLYVAPYQMIAPVTRRWWGVSDGAAPAVTKGILTPRSNYWGDL